MSFRITNFNELDRAAFRVITAFLNGRLEERATINWALHLKPNEKVMRTSLLELIDSPAGRRINEPWRSAWRLIEESWNYPEVEDHASTGVYDAQHRLLAGDRSGSLIKAIVRLVAPRLKIEPFSHLNLQYRKLPKRPQRVKDLFSTALTSGKIVDPGILELDSITDRSFLLSLANAVEASVVYGVDTAQRINWDGKSHLWNLGQLDRVYYVPAEMRTDDEDEPDEVNRGIAPSVKLLYAVVSRLVDIDNSCAIEYAQRWKLTNSPVHMRLWAALSRDSRVTPANEVGSLLLLLDNRRFWGLDDYPEIAELRAIRFDELDPHDQTTVTTRIKRRPPRNLWPRKADADKVKNARLYWAIRELRRIEIAGAILPRRDKVWLEARIHEFPHLVQMKRLDEGFLKAPKVEWGPPNPDNRYDLVTGEERLKALEAALSLARTGWGNNNAEGAAHWIRQPGNLLQIISDLETIPDGGATFPGVWDQLGWFHSPATVQSEDVALRDMSVECTRVLSLLAILPEATVSQAIEGISQWLSAWEKQFVLIPESLSIWLKIWPLAVEATNTKQTVKEEIYLNTVLQSSDDHEPRDLETLNTPAGKLIGVFLTTCPNLEQNEHPFDVDGAPRMMRDAVIAADGRSALIARHRLIEYLPYFLRAAPDWANKNLITPLITDNFEAINLWNAIARRTHFSNVLKIIGGPMAERATDRRLSRETRRSLVFSLVVECLYAFNEQREPAVPYPRIQQMIRSLDEEVRAYGAEAVQLFVSSSRRRGQASLPEHAFRTAAMPFIQKVWPQERSLATPGVSRALAKLPATARQAFDEAVATIECFLVPFECWSMLEYGLFGEENGNSKLSIIDNPEKAVAFLRLLDRTIGIAEGSVIPYDLADALDQIRRAAPNMTENQAFRRLATVARR